MKMNEVFSFTHTTTVFKHKFWNLEAINKTFDIFEIIIKIQISV